MCFYLQLEYDVLEYVVIERLAQVGREKLKDDGLNLSDWLQSLASFWGHLYVLLRVLVKLHLSHVKCNLLAIDLYAMFLCWLLLVIYAHWSKSLNILGAIYTFEN